MFDSLDDVTINSVIESFDQCNNIFRRTRNELLTERINAIVRTLQDDGENFGNIDIIVKNFHTQRILNSAQIVTNMLPHRREHAGRVKIAGRSFFIEHKQ